MDKDTYYIRQKVLKEVGEEGQKIIDAASVLIVGAGGLGHPAAMYLAASGVGTIGICDFDIIEASNLHRQILFSPEDIHKNKSTILKERISKQNPFINVVDINHKITHENGESLFSEYDIIVDCSDNFETKFLLHDLCFVLKKDLVQSSIYQYEGQLQVFKYSIAANLKDGCLRCLWPETPDSRCVGNCAVAGVLGAVAGMFGSLQAMEVLKCILSMNNGLKHRQTMIIDLLTYEINKIKWKHDPNCFFCGDEQNIELIKLKKENLKDDLSIKYELLDDDIQILDVREINHFTILKKYQLDKNKKYVLACNKGVKSYKLTKQLRNLGYKYTYSLVDGYEGIRSGN